MRLPFSLRGVDTVGWPCTAVGDLCLAEYPSARLRSRQSRVYGPQTGNRGPSSGTARARDPRPTTAQAALLLAFEPLQQAASSWLAAIEQVDEYSRYDLSHDEEQDAQAVHLLLIESYDHLLQVACLSVRLVQELHQVLDAPVREALVPRDGQERKEAL